MSERGDASVEFLGILVVLVIPVLYIVLAVGQVSAGAMAADAGAREAARILAEDVERQADAEHAVALIAEDFGVSSSPSMSSTCGACGSADGMVEVSVSVRVPLPFLPAWFGGVGVDVSSSASAPVREVVSGG